MSKSAIAPTTEVVASILTTGIGNQAGAVLQSDPRGVIAQATGFEIEDNVDISVVANTDKTVNLVLPYYDILDENPPALMADADMSDASGGWAAGLDSLLKSSNSSLIGDLGQGMYYGRNYTIRAYDLNNDPHKTGAYAEYSTGGAGSMFWRAVDRHQARIDAESAAVADAFSK